MRVNVNKSVVTGIDYATGQGCDVTMIEYGGEKLDTLGIHEAYKYLGIHIRMDLQWTQEKRYVLDKVRNAADKLRHTCYTRSQIMMLANMCVVPLFRYSTAIVPWTEAEINEFDKIWARTMKWSLKLPQSFDMAPLQFPVQQGGGASHSTRKLIIDELQTHIRQCLRNEDEVFVLISKQATLVAHTCGLWDEKAIDQVRATPQMRTVGTTSTIWRLQFLLPQGMYIEGTVHRPPEPAAPLILTKFRESRARHPLTSTQLAAALKWDILSKEERESLAQQKKWADYETKMLKCIIQLHLAGIYSLFLLIAQYGWDFRSFATLPQQIQRECGIGCKPNGTQIHDPLQSEVGAAACSMQTLG
jgi:hypothetical protein